jgi:phosphate transport system substrate-binding protein
MEWNFIRRMAVLLAAAAYALAASAGEHIRGAGATFPAPVYAAWAKAYQQSNDVQISYDAVGSGAGIERIRQRQVDFGASDAPLTAEELANAQLIQFLRDSTGKRLWPQDR